MRTVEMGRVACWAVIGLGVAAFLWNAGIDVEYWATQAKTARGAVEMAGASVIFQLMVLAFAGIAGHLLFRKSYLLGGLAGMVLLFFLAYNMMSVMSFQARERIAPAKLAEEQYRAQIDAELNAQVTQNERQEAAIKTLREDALAASAALKRAKTKDQRLAAQEAKRAADNAYLESSFATVTAKALPAREKVADPQAEMIAMALGLGGISVPIEQIQLIASAWWGIGLNLAKVICWFFGFGLMPGRRPRQVATAAPGLTMPVAHEPAPEPMRRTLSVVPPIPIPAEETHRALSSLDEVEEFLSEATRPASGARITATVMHQHFLKWAEIRGYPRLNQNLFGRHCTSLGLERDPDRKQTIVYVGVGLCPLYEEDHRLVEAA